MGILNVTPDSFYDGGKYPSIEKAVEAGEKMVFQGADIIDIGGESSRPGSEAISVEVELERVIPVIKSLASMISIPISIDTTKSVVAEAAIKAGASIVNDISGLKFDKHMAAIVEKNSVPVVIMHIKGTPKTMQNNTGYNDLLAEIKTGLEESIKIGKKAGIPDEMFILDPGIGFGKNRLQNLLIVKELQLFKNMGYPLLIGPSRKSFIGDILSLSPEERLEGTAAVTAIGILNGADIVRVHDVPQMVRVAKMADAIKYLNPETQI